MKPLQGMRVLDFSKVLAGPLCTQSLGDLGADVIKVEPPGLGDETRGWPPFHGASFGAVFLSVNRNKRSISLDLKTERGQAIARQLAATADVVVESYATGISQRLGVDYDTLRQGNERLVYCSISGFGRTGPLKGGLGYDVILQAFSGIMGMTGERGGGPVRSPFSPIDQTTGIHAYAGILAALLERNRTGQGSYLEVSLFETAVALLGYTLQTYWEKGTLPDKVGSGHESLCPYQAFRAADGDLLIGIANDNLWRRFCRAVGREALIEDPRFRSNADRVRNFDATVGLVQDIVATRARADWAALFQEIGVPCAAVNTIRDLLDHPQTAARGVILDYRHPDLGALKGVVQPIQFNGETRGLVSPPPGLGQHTAEILAELGLAPGDVASLQEAGVIAGVAPMPARRAATQG